MTGLGQILTIIALLFIVLFTFLSSQSSCTDLSNVPDSIHGLLSIVIYFHNTHLMWLGQCLIHLEITPSGRRLHFHPRASPSLWQEYCRNLTDSPTVPWPSITKRCESKLATLSWNLALTSQRKHDWLCFCPLTSEVRYPLSLFHRKKGRPIEMNETTDVSYLSQCPMVIARITSLAFPEDLG